LASDSALASSSFSVSRPVTSSGIAASLAGRNIRPTTSMANAQKYTQPSHGSTGSATAMPARIRSEASITRRRFHRLTTRAATGPPTADGSSRNTKIPPTAVVDPLSSRTKYMSANVPVQSPSREIACPSRRRRKSRRASNSFIALPTPMPLVLGCFPPSRRRNKYRVSCPGRA
jgi:hypothetical protein